MTRILQVIDVRSLRRDEDRRKDTYAPQIHVKNKKSMQLKTRAWSEHCCDQSLASRIQLSGLAKGKHPRILAVVALLVERSASAMTLFCGCRYVPVRFGCARQSENIRTAGAATRKTFFMFAFCIAPNKSTSLVLQAIPSLHADSIRNLRVLGRPLKADTPNTLLR